MKFFLRVEGVNLGNFVDDTNDLATIRGGSLLLLEAMDIVENKIKEQFEGNSISSEADSIREKMRSIDLDKSKKKPERKSEKARLRVLLREQIVIDEETIELCENPTITKGASWGLFQFDVNKPIAEEIKNNIIKSFNDCEKYQHATFVVDLYELEENEDYQLSRDKVQSLNRFQQLMVPSLALTNQGKDVCVLNKIKPASSEQYIPSNTDEKKRDYMSDSVSLRRKYGRDQKKFANFYKKITKLENIDELEITKDLEQLSSNSKFCNLEGKIAFIYIDGNQFGNMQRNTRSIVEQRNFDTQTREGREKVLRNIIEKIKDEPAWLADKRLRLETLLWGGDEIVWVVPAWQGWWMLNQFYQRAKEHIVLKSYDDEGRYIATKELFHGSSIIFCKHTAPIHRVKNLAKSLADQFAKKTPFKQKNMIAYQVLESFDHIGLNLRDHRLALLQGLRNDPNEAQDDEQMANLLVNAEQMSAIEACIFELKKAEFPRRKIYQIVQQYRMNLASNAGELRQKLTGEDHSDFNPSKQQEIYKAELEKLKKIFDGHPVYWLHLMELWDYVAANPDN